ncbi:MAG: nitroreductase family protein [Desulfobacterales bacterium]|nr:nitroreductase family protein [Desulfobacterales bacterium]
MTFDELLGSRRSVRNYRQDPVSQELITEMINESTLAPNAGNEQPWKFIVINNQAVMKRISDESKRNILARIAANPDDYASRYKTILEKEGYNVFYNAPCLVMILGPARLRNIYADCTLAAAYFMLAAASRGLGTCWVNLGRAIEDQEMLTELGVPDDCDIIAPIALGYPTQIPPVPKRKPPEILKIID